MNFFKSFKNVLLLLIVSIIIGFGVSYITGLIGYTKSEQLTTCSDNDRNAQTTICAGAIQYGSSNIIWKNYGLPISFRAELVSAPPNIDMLTSTYSTNKFLLNSAIWSIIIFGGTSGILLLLDKNKRK